MMASIKELAKISDNVYDDGKMEPPPDWEIEGKIIKIFHGFQAAVYKKGEEKVVAFCGSNLEDRAHDWFVDDFMIFLKLIPPQAVSAILFFEMIVSSEMDINKENFLNYADSKKNYSIGDCFAGVSGIYDNITVTGHSLGGALAAIVANKFGVKGCVFNAPGIIGLSNSFHNIDGTKWKVSMSEFCYQAFEIKDRMHTLYVLERGKYPDISETDIKKKLMKKCEKPLIPKKYTYWKL